MLNEPQTAYLSSPSLQPGRKWWKTECFPYKNETRQVRLFPRFHFNILQVFLPNARHRKNKIEAIPIGKELLNLSLRMQRNYLLGKYQRICKKLFELMNGFRKVIGYKRQSSTCHGSTEGFTTSPWCESDTHSAETILWILTFSWPTDMWHDPISRCSAVSVGCSSPSATPSWG